MLSTGRLQILDVFFGHVDQQTQVSGISPQTNLGQFVEEKLPCLELFVFRAAFYIGKDVGKASRQFKDCRATARKGVALLSKEDVVLSEVFRDGEAFM